MSRNANEHQGLRVATAAAGASLLIPLAAVLLFPPFYQTNDDVAMRLLAEGNFVPGTGPLPFLMHINVVIGGLLRVLYGLIPSLPWYDLVLGASMTAAAAGFLCIWLGARGWHDLAWTAVLSIVYLVPAFVNVQFSVAGMGCAAAGIALLLQAAVAPLDQRFFRFHLFLGATLIVWGSLIRAEGAALILLEGAILAMPLSMAVLHTKDLRLRMKSVLLAGAAAIILAVVAFGVNQLVYQRAPGWQEFHRYNFLRTRITEYVSADRMTPQTMEQVTRRAGWTTNDFLLFRNWFFADPNLFSFARVQAAERLLFSAARQPTKTYRTRLSELWNTVKSYFGVLLPAFVVLALFSITWRGRIRLILFLAFALLTVNGLIALITSVAKAPPERVTWPMAMLVAGIVPVAARRWGHAAPSVVDAVALVAAAYFVSATLADLHQKTLERRVRFAGAVEDVAELRKTGATFFLLHGGAFPYEDYWRPLRIERTPFPFVGLGVSARTPPVQAYLKRTGRADLALALCTDRNIVLVAHAYVPPLLRQFALEHHKRNVRYEPLLEGKRFTAWRCVSASPEDTAHDDP